MACFIAIAFVGCGIGEKLDRADITSNTWVDGSRNISFTYYLRGSPKGLKCRILVPYYNEALQHTQYVTIGKKSLQLNGVPLPYNHEGFVWIWNKKILVEIPIQTNWFIADSNTAIGHPKPEILKDLLPIAWPGTGVE